MNLREMKEQDEILKDVIYNINKTNHELNRLKIILKDNKKQLRHKNIVIVFLFIIILCLSILNGCLLINNKNNPPTTARGYYKDSDSAIITNNKLDAYTTITVVYNEKSAVTEEEILSLKQEISNAGSKKYEVSVDYADSRGQVINKVTIKDI